MDGGTVTLNQLSMVKDSSGTVKQEAEYAGRSDGRSTFSLGIEGWKGWENGKVNV